jgi:choline monooxygenase
VSLAIDPEIRRAQTLPGSFYRDPAVFERQRERLFARSWQLVGDRNLVRVPGSVHPFVLLEGLLDEPLCFSRTQGDQVHLFSNVCTHRGALVVEHPACVPSLRCRYHGRRFGLDGRFLSMPECQDTENFPAPSDDLPRAAWGEWGRWLFAALDPFCPLDELLAEIDRRVGFLPFEQMVFAPERSRDYLVKANWALYCDNYLEGFHIPFVHPGLATALDYGAYRTELFRWSNVQVGVADSDDVEVFDLPASSPDHGQRIAGYYFWVFPNLMLNFYPWGLSANIVKPLAIDRTRVSYLAWVLDPGMIADSAGADLDRVEREDEAVVESVQRGIRARLYHRGRYSPKRETGVHHFHRLLAEHLADDIARP